jgi:carbon-monoxide dehydrogenase large subunit
VAVAGKLLSCEPSQVQLADDRAYSGRDFHAMLTFAELATAAVRQARMAGASGDALVIETTYELPANPFAFAAHIAEVEVDRDTGAVRLKRFVAVHDCGPMINPMIVRGQIQGGITQGIGQALSEGVTYDANGQPLAASFMTYGLPGSEDVPAFILENMETPSPTNPLGIKGIGELPTVASPVAVANAVADALAQAGADASGLDMPLTPDKVWKALSLIS